MATKISKAKRETMRAVSPLTGVFHHNADAGRLALFSNH